jgi:branched-chain amino acid transport system ATP-binding protein
MSILELDSVCMAFGGLMAVDHLSFKVEKGEIIGLIGPNGSGKTTTINCISGFLKTTGGKIIFNGKDITGKSPDDIAKHGLTRTFQLTQLLPTSTVQDNVMVGLHLRTRYGLWDAIARLPSAVRKEKQNLAAAMEVIDFLGLDAVKDRPCSSISHYERKKLGLAIALASNPEMVLVDEVVSGVSNEETGLIMDVVRAISKRGTTVLLVEHNMKVIMGLCNHIVVINFGARIAEGNPLEIQNNEQVKTAYLGCENA